MSKSIKDFVSIIRKIRFVISSKLRRQSIFVFASMFLASCLELLGVSSIYPLALAMLDLENLKTKWYVKPFTSIFPSITNKGILLCLCLVVVSIFLMKNAMAIYLGYVQQRFCANFLIDTSETMISSFLKHPYEYFVNTNSSVIIRGINTDTESVYLVLISLLQIAGEMISIVMIGLFLLVTDWFVTIFTISAVVAFTLLITLRFKQLVKNAGKVVNTTTSETYKCAYQAVNGIKEVFTLNRGTFFVEEYMKLCNKSSRARLVYNVLSSCPNRILEAVCVTAFVVIICIKQLTTKNSEAFAPILAVFAMGAFRILPSFAKISSRINSIVYYQPGLQNCYNNISEARSFNEKRLMQTEAANRVSKYETDKELPETFQKLELRDITWKYQNSDTPIIRNLNLVVNKGESIALIGASGAGKTTLADIIMGLLKPQFGIVEADGINIFSIPSIWSRTIGYVPQNVFLIDDTIRANVAFGLPRECLSDAAVWKALDQAQLKEFVEECPDKLDTIVGERGMKLSGGQRQRIAIARALYNNPEILVLDEATSALDSETETAVMESIDDLRGRKTLIIIAHRLTTIRNCNKVYEVIGGKAIQRDKAEMFLTEA